MSNNFRVKVIDSVDHNLDAEETAMLASLRSRSPLPVEDLLEKVKKNGSEKMMQEFYLGYGASGKRGSKPGHGSIAQSGSTNVNLEEVSMLAALAFEDHALFNGQENSTRYLPFENANVYVPEFNGKSEHAQEAAAIMAGWFNVYKVVFAAKFEELKKLEPCPNDVEPKVWEKALKCRAFDVASGFLPAGTKTNLTWHSTLDNTNNVIQNMLSHPLGEVRDIAEATRVALDKRYPNSIKEDLPEGHREYLNRYSEIMNYSEISLNASRTDNKQELISDFHESIVIWSMDKANAESTHGCRLMFTPNAEELLMNRPRYMYPPAVLKTAGILQIHGCLDLACFRELHRHRDGNIPTPILDADNGIHSWYMRNIPDDVTFTVQEDIQDLLKRSKKLSVVSPWEFQYTLPMGIRVMVELNWSLPQLIYFCELRTGQTCKGPIRKFAQALATKFMDAFPNAKLYANMEPDQIQARRATQDIGTKNENGDVVSMSDGEVIKSADELKREQDNAKELDLKEEEFNELEAEVRKLFAELKPTAEEEEIAKAVEAAGKAYFGAQALGLTPSVKGIFDNLVRY